jgi:hypothetical protein
MFVDVPAFTGCDFDTCIIYVKLWQILRGVCLYRLLENDGSEFPANILTLNSELPMKECK